MFGVFPTPWPRNILGEERYAWFLSLANGDHDLVPALVSYDEKLNNVLLCDLRRMELMLRNDYDRTMRLLWPGSKHWLMDPDCYAHRMLVRRYPRLGKAILTGTATPAMIVSNVSFGFWHQLSTSAAEKPLWVPYLHRAFAPGADRGQIHATVERLVKCRNRVAHHEPVLALPIQALVNDMMWLSDIVLPPLAIDMRVNSDTQRFLASLNRPTSRQSFLTPLADY